MGWGRRIKSGSLFGNSQWGSAANAATMQTLTANKVGHALHGDSLSKSLHYEGEGNPWVAQRRVGETANGEALDSQAKTAAAQQAYIGKNLGLVDESYGIGDSDAAKANAGSLGNLYSGLVSSYRMQGDKNLNDNFAHTLTQNRATMANSGLNGSGVDAAQQTANVGELATGKQRVNEGSANYLDSLKSTINSQRLGLKDQIRSNGAVDLGDSTTFSMQDQALKQAIGNIPNQTLGNIFTQAGQTYSQGNTAGAYGYQGNGALGLRVNPSGGRGAGRVG